MIEQYLILSIPRLIKRHWAALTGAVVQGVPYEIIRFKQGVEARDYTSMQDVAEKAAAEGYTFLRQFGLDKNDGIIYQSKQNMALFWGWTEALKYIAESGLTTLLTWDDRIPAVKFSVLQEIMGYLNTQPSPFMIWQLRIRTIPADVKFVCTEDEIKEILPDDIEKTRADFIKSIEGFDIQNINFAMPSGETINLNPKDVVEERDYGHYIRKGIIGYDETMVLSPAGAAWLLRQILEMEDRTEMLKQFEFANRHENIMTEETVCPEMRSRLNNDNWVHWELNAIAKEAVKSNYGIYTSRKMGYDFVYEPFAFNTTIFWDSGKELDTNSNPLVRIRFIEDKVFDWHEDPPEDPDNYFPII